MVAFELLKLLCVRPVRVCEPDSSFRVLSASPKSYICSAYVNAGTEVRIQEVEEGPAERRSDCLRIASIDHHAVPTEITNGPRAPHRQPILTVRESKR